MLTVLSILVEIAPKLAVHILKESWVANSQGIFKRTEQDI